MRREPAGGQPSREGWTVAEGGQEPDARLPVGVGPGRRELGDERPKRAVRAQQRMKGADDYWDRPGPRRRPRGWDGGRQETPERDGPSQVDSPDQWPSTPPPAGTAPARAKNRAALAPNPAAPYLACGSTDVRSAALRASLEEVAGIRPQPALTPALPLAAPPPAPRTHATHARAHVTSGASALAERTRVFVGIRCGWRWRGFLQPQSLKARGRRRLRRWSRGTDLERSGAGGEAGVSLSFSRSRRRTTLPVWHSSSHS